MKKATCSVEENLGILENEIYDTRLSSFFFLTELIELFWNHPLYPISVTSIS